MAIYPNILARKIPWTGKPGGLQSIGLQRVRHGLVTEQQQQRQYFTNDSKFATQRTFGNFWSFFFFFSL